MLVDNVTFEPGARNNWYIHMAGQTLFVTEGKGWYQEEGKAPILCKAGDIIHIPAGVKHFHAPVKIVGLFIELWRITLKERQHG